KSDAGRKVIVVSAPGKRHDKDDKITDLLIRLGKSYLNKEKYKSYIITILDRFSTIAEELNIPLDIVDEIEASINEIMASEKPKAEMLDCFKAIGEDSSAKILSGYLKTLGLDAHYVNPKDAGIILRN